MGRERHAGGQHQTKYVRKEHRYQRSVAGLNDVSRKREACDTSGIRGLTCID
jgi:hypothetical protein